MLHLASIWSAVCYTFLVRSKFQKFLHSAEFNAHFIVKTIAVDLMWNGSNKTPLIKCDKVNRDVPSGQSKNSIRFSNKICSIQWKPIIPSNHRRYLDSFVNVSTIFMYIYRTRWADFLRRKGKIESECLTVNCKLYKSQSSLLPLTWSFFVVFFFLLSNSLLRPLRKIGCRVKEWVGASLS